MQLQTFTKHSAEAYTKAIDYSDRLPSGTTIASVACSALDLGDGSSAAVVSGVGSVTGGTVANFAVTGGTDGHTYIITITSTLAAAAGTLVDQIVMFVSDRQA